MPDAQNNLITIGDDGSIGADFTGHVAANGIDLTAGVNGTPPPDRKIQWHKDNKTGATVAELTAYTLAPDTPLNFASFGAISPTGDNRGTITVQAGDGQPSGISLFAGFAATLLLDTGQSDWVQKADIQAAVMQGPWNNGVNIASVFTVNIPSTSMYYIIYQGSAYMTGAPRRFGIDLYLDGVLAVTNNFFANEINSHKATNISGIKRSLTKGIHHLAFNAGAPDGVVTSSDNNDTGFILLIPTVN